MNIQGWFPLGLTALISLLSRGLSRVVFSSTTIWKHQLFSSQPYFMVQLSHPYMTIRKIIALTIWTFVGIVMSLFFTMLSSFPSKKQVSFNFMAAVTIMVILEPPKIESVPASTLSPSICHEVMGPDAMTLVFWTLIFPCLALTVASCTAYRFLRRQIRWSGSHISLRNVHSLL